MLEIRPMEIDDLDDVMSIEAASFSVPWTRKDFEDSINKQMALYLVAVLDEQIVGYCGLWGVVDEGQINNVAVSSVYRGRKIGFQLLTELVRSGVDVGLAAFTLEVRVSNVAAIALYKKLGFEEAGVRKNYYTAPKEDALIMWRYPQKNSKDIDK